ncbi:MAG: NHLP bacteriocin system secretion protein [Synechococcaceae cyanobacterium]|nr:NHLP bacteriocin system secretion protein [Synechococcaceae cyanobacterium]
MSPNRSPLFRQAALDARSTPEQLDRPLPLMGGGTWALLLGLLCFVGAVGVWSVLGRVPVRLSGQGVLIAPNTLRLIQSESEGRVEAVYAEAGRCVTQGTRLLRLSPMGLQTEREKTARQLQELIRHDRQESRMAQQQLFSTRRDLNRLLPYRSSGAIAEQTYVDKELAIQRLESQIAMEANSRRQEISERQLELRRLAADIHRSSDVLAPVAGCINDLRVQVGNVVQPGQAVIELDASQRGTVLESLAFFPAQDAKRIQVGQPVQVTPETTRAQRHGAIQGRVVSVQTLPVSEEALLNRLGSRSLVEALRSRGGGALIEVRTRLRRSAATYSGYDWGGGTGPRLKLSAGTPTQVRVLVEQRQPISYLVPILRDLSGIY